MCFGAFCKLLWVTVVTSIHPLSVMACPIQGHWWAPAKPSWHWVKVENTLDNHWADTQRQTKMTYNSNIIHRALLVGPLSPVNGATLNDSNGGLQFYWLSRTVTTRLYSVSTQCGGCKRVRWVILLEQLGGIWTWLFNRCINECNVCVSRVLKCVLSIWTLNHEQFLWTVCFIILSESQFCCHSQKPWEERRHYLLSTNQKIDN